MPPRPRTGSIAYLWKEAVYVNLTNRCPTACVFCAKRAWEWRFRGSDLLLAREPSVDEAWAELDQALGRIPLREVVFCGYGEPTYRLPALCALARRLKRRQRVRVRLNTIGLGAIIWRRDIAPLLARHLDAVSVSLNTADSAQWAALHLPAPEFRERGFQAACEFVARCARAGVETSVTAVEQPGIDLERVAQLAGSLGARFLLRPELV